MFTEIYLGIVVVVGLLSNFCCIICFATAKLRRKSCNIFLLALATADFGFLLTLLVIWLRTFEIELDTQPFVCKILNYR